ncbi:Mbov_0121 family peptidase domain-containing ABC transporter [Mycoplasmopsis synoviae]|nr:cysteine peptidase family C39 domain-containing protein [Mycoplasmopsis synoviae]
MEKQFDSRDCSLYVLKYFYNHFYSHNVNINDLKINAIYSDSGIKLTDLHNIAINFNLNFDAFNCNKTELLRLEKNLFPLGIIFKENNEYHMVVLEKIKNDKYYIYDPLYGKQKLNEFDFYSKFSEKVIYFSKLKNEVKENKIKKFDLNFKNLFLYKIIYFIFLLLEVFLTFMLPFFNKFVFDQIIPNFLKKELFLSFIVIAWIVLIKIIFKYSANLIINKKITSTICEIKSLFINNLKSKNFKKINLINENEMQTRLNAFDEIIKFKMSFTSEVVVNLITLLFSFILLWNINLMLLIILLSYSFIVFVINFLNKRYNENNYVQIYNLSLDDARNFSNYFNSIKNIYHPKIEKQIYSNWNLKHFNLHKKVLDYEVKNSLFESFLNFSEILAPILILIFGSIEIWNSKLTLINLIFFITGASLFTNPIKSILPLTHQYVSYKKQKNILNFFDLNLEEKTEKSNISKIQKIQLSYIDFKFTNNKRYDLNIDRLIIDKNIILQGNNGSGKTTLCSIIAGKNKIDNGEILINDSVVNLFDDYDLKSKILYLGFDKHPVNIPVLDYLDINEESYFNILKILNLEKAFSNLLSKNLTSLSTGELQVIKLFKIFTSKYDVIIFDEAFENVYLEIFEKFKTVIKKYFVETMFIEISHSQRYVFENSEVYNLQAINLR